MGYRQWQVLRSPVWLRDPDGEALEGELGGAKDVLSDTVRQGILARFPDFGAPDSQNAVGADRNLPRGYLQGDESYAGTLKNAWNLWPGTEDDTLPGGAGSHAGMLRELLRQGFWPAYIVQDNGRWTTLDTNGDLVVGWLSTSNRRGRPAWRFTQQDGFWSQFGILFPGPLPPLVQVTATATFIGTDRATAVWSQAWDDTNYMIAASPPIAPGPIPVINTDLETVTQKSIDVVASAPWTGTVDLISWIPGACPFASPSVSTVQKLAELVRLWKPGYMTYRGAVAMLTGIAWGWPTTLKWGDAGLKWGANTTVQIGP